jgi:hypothetical protein
VGVDPVPKLGVGSRVHLALAKAPEVEPLLVWARVVRAGGAAAGLSLEDPVELRDRARLAALVASLVPVPARRAPPASAAPPETGPRSTKAGA